MVDHRPLLADSHDTTTEPAFGKVFFVATATAPLKRMVRFQRSPSSPREEQRIYGFPHVLSHGIGAYTAVYHTWEQTTEISVGISKLAHRKGM